MLAHLPPPEDPKIKIVLLLLFIGMIGGLYFIGWILNHLA